MEVQWALVIFTLFICLASGLFAGTGILVLLGKGKKIWLPAIITSFVALVIGGLASFFHLQHWDRLFNGFGNPTSGITQELIGLVIFVIALVVYYMVSRKEGTPKWAGILAIVIGIAMVVVMSQSYMMAARPVWYTILLHAFYLAQMVVAGGAGLWLIGAIVKDEDVHQVNARFTTIGGALVIISLVAYVAYVSTLTFTQVGNYFDPSEPTKAMVETTGFAATLLTGDLAIYFWSAVLLGGAVVAILGFLKWKKSNNALIFSSVALICALGGGIAFRAVLYLLGISAYAFY